MRKCPLESWERERERERDSGGGQGKIKMVWVRIGSDGYKELTCVTIRSIVFKIKKVSETWNLTAWLLIKFAR